MARKPTPGEARTAEKLAVPVEDVQRVLDTFEIAMRELAAEKKVQR